VEPGITPTQMRWRGSGSHPPHIRTQLTGIHVVILFPVLETEVFDSTIIYVDPLLRLLLFLHSVAWPSSFESMIPKPVYN